MSQAASNYSESTLGYILTKLGVVLQRTKDALLIDLQKEIKAVGAEEERLPTEVIEKIFERIGVDLECLSKREAVKEMGTEMLNLFDHLGELCEQVKELDGSDESALKQITPVLSEVFKNVQKMVKLAKEFEELEVEQVTQEFEELGDEIKNAVKELAPKLVDHVLITLLHHAREVFHDDLVLLEARKNEILTEIDRQKRLLVQVGEEARQLLQQRVAEIEKELKQAGNENGELIREVVDVMSKTYAILDFLGVIGDKDITRIQKVVDDAQDQALSLIGSKDKKLIHVPAQVKVICWDRFEDLFTNPIDYFKKLYPIDDIDDAGDLIAKVMDIARMFNPDVPDFSSLQTFLETLLEKLEDKVVMASKEAANDLWKDLEPVVVVLRKVLNFLKQLAQKLLELPAEIVESVKQEVAGLRLENPLEDVMRQISGNATLDFVCTEILQPAIEKGYKDMGVTYDASVADTFATEVKDWHRKSVEQITEFISPDAWEKRLDTLASRLKEELSNDKEALFKGKFEELSITDYTEIITEEVDKISVPDLDECYDGFIESIEKAAASVGGTLDQMTDPACIKKFVMTVAQTIWENVKKKVLKPIARKLYQMVSSWIRAKIRELIRQLLQRIDQMPSLPGLDALSFERQGDQAVMMVQIPVAHQEGQQSIQLTESVRVVIPHADWVKEVVEETIAFVQTEMGVKDILNYVVAVFRNFPGRDKLEDLLPSLDWNIEGKEGDESYTFSNDFDVDCNKEQMFVMVNLFNIKGSLKEESGHELSASLLMQLFVAACEVGEEKTPALYCKFMVKGDLSAVFAIGENHVLQLGMSGDTHTSRKDMEGTDLENLQKGMGCYLKQGWNVDWENGGWKEFSSSLNISFSRKKEAGPVEVFNSQYADFKIGDYPQNFFMGINREGKEGFDVGYVAALKDAELLLKLKQCGFLKDVLQDDVSLKFDTEIGYSLQGGFLIDGDVCLHLVYDLNNKKLGPVTIQNFSVDVDTDGDDKGTVYLGAGTSFQVEFQKAVTLAIENLSLGMSVNYLKENGKIGDFDLDPSFKFPTGIGVAVDTQVVKGGGMISINQDTGEFFGALELSVIKKFGINGFVICDPGTEDGHDFNFIVSLSMISDVGIPLGMGFTLTGIGGNLGLDRSINRDGLMQGVRKGTLGSVFFVKDIKNHMAEMQTTVNTYFPAKKNQFFLGMLAQISFKPLLTCDFGLMLQFPKPTSIIILGALKVGIGKLEDLIQINVYFAGGIDFEEGMWFDASIVDSKIMGITLSGDMAFRLNWGGKNKGFLLSVGGFHPDYTPEPGLKLGEMKRLAMSLDYSVMALNLQAYLAVSSNTFQIGARVDLKVDLKVVGISGYTSFDALFQFDPFMFMTAITAGVTFKVFGFTLMGMDLAFELSGPAGWHAAGAAKFTFLTMDISADFSFDWGKEAKELPTTTVEVAQLLTEEFNRAENWQVVRMNGENAEIELLPQDDQVLQPDGFIIFNQNSVPFVTEAAHTGDLINEVTALAKMDKCNDAAPTDYDRVQLLNVTLAVGDEDEELNVENEVNDFAPVLYQLMTATEKLEAPSYVKYNGGFRCGKQDLMGSEESCMDNFEEIYEDFFQEADFAVAQNDSRNVSSAWSKRGVDEAQQPQRNATDFARYVKSLDKKLQESC